LKSLILSFLVDDKFTRMESSNTSSLFKVINSISERIKEIQLTQVIYNDEKIDLSLFSFLLKDNKIIVPLRMIKRNFYDKTLKYIVKSTHKKQGVVIKEGNHYDSTYIKQLEELYIKEPHIRGVLYYKNRLARIFRKLEDFLVRQIENQGFKEIISPKITSWNTWITSGHLVNVNSELFPISKTMPIEVRDKAIFSFFNETNPSFGGVEIGGMTYSQCENFWSILTPSYLTELINEGGCIFDRSGPSYRQERKNLDGMRRLSEFRRIELIFIGTKEKIQQLIIDLKKMYSVIYDKLELKPYITEVDPWDGISGGLSIDYEIMIDKEPLETNNLNNNDNRYPLNFLNKSELYSGCSGIGLDRLLYALISTKGIEEVERLFTIL
jgi:seryl-tRNA synthetase